MSIYLCKCNKIFWRRPIIYAITELCNHFHTQQLKHAKFNVHQQAKLVQKFLAKNELLLKKKRAQLNRDRNAQILSTATFNRPDEPHHPRLKRLNKIFFEKITEILATSECFGEIVEKGLEVTQVKVQSRFSAIYVYWFCSKVEHVDELSEFVTKLATYIRQEFSNQRVIGRIPPILFIRDDALKIGVEVDRLLQIADFGPDFKPVHSIAESHMPEPPVIQKEISKEDWMILDDIAEEKDGEAPLALSEENQISFDIQPIRQDIFGVNREKIMNMVKKGCKDSKALHRQSEVKLSSPVSHDDANLKAIFTRGSYSSYSAHSRSLDIKKWVSQYKKTRKQKIKREEMMDNTYLPNFPRMENEEEERELDIDTELFDELQYKYDDLDINDDER